MFCLKKINRNQSRVELEIQLKALDPQTLKFISFLGCSYSSIQNLIFLIIFVTSCYVLNKNSILSENSMPGRFETTPGQEIQPGNWNWQSNHRKIIENWENEKTKKNTPKSPDSSIFRLQISIFALLTQQIIKMRDPSARERIKWLVELIWPSS